MQRSAFHTVFLDGVYAPDRDGNGQMFHPAPAPSQHDIEQVVGRAGKRILRFLQRRGVIMLATAPGDGEVNVASDESAGEADPLLAKLLAAATSGAPVPSGPRDGQPTCHPLALRARPSPAGWAHKRKPVRMVLDPDDQPPAKGTLCAASGGFNLHAATRVATNDKAGRERLCRYILRPPFANDRLSLLSNGNARLELKRPWSGGDGRGAAAWRSGGGGRP